MTNLRKPMLLAVAAVACAAVSPVKAAPSAQDIFAKLAQREAPAEMQPAKRAAALPALALLPPGADALFAAAEAGESAEALAELFDCKSGECGAALSCVGSLAMSAGNGGAAAFARALPALVYASQLASLEEWETRWCEHAKPELVGAIHRGFQPQRDLAQRNLLTVLAECHLKPVYAALTAVPGREAEFHKLCECVQQAMRRASEGGKWRSVEQAGYSAGLCTTQLQLWKQLTGEEPASAPLRALLEQRELYLLMQERDGAMVLALCESPSDISLPQNAESSLIYTPQLAGADAHIDQLRAAAWVSADFFRALQRCMYAEPNPLLLALANCFRELGAASPREQGIYTQAVDAAMLLNSTVAQDELARITHPMQMQIWQPSPDTLRAHTTLDAGGARFEPGELRLTSCATLPSTIYYTETTAFTCPGMPSQERRITPMLSIGQALLLSLREDSQDSIKPLLHTAAMLAPEAVALEDAVQTLCSALGAPLALVSGDGAPGEDPAVALCAAVKSRAGLAESWQQMLSAFSRVVSKLGLPEALVNALPIESRDLGQGAAGYALQVPFLPKEMHPSLAVSDSYWALGYSPALNARLVAEAGSGAGRMSFSGAVSAVSFPGWAKTARTMTDRAGDKPGSAMRTTCFLERLAAKASLLLHSTTIRDGAFECGTVMKLKK